MRWFMNALKVVDEALDRSIPALGGTNSRRRLKVVWEIEKIVGDRLVRRAWAYILNIRPRRDCGPEGGCERGEGVTGGVAAADGL